MAPCAPCTPASRYTQTATCHGQTLRDQVLADDGTRFLGLRSCGPIAVSTSIISRFGLRLGGSSTGRAVVGTVVGSFIPSITLTGPRACAASEVSMYSIMASSCSSVRSLSGLLCWTLCSRGISRVRHRKYTPGCSRRTLAMAFSPCSRKSRRSAQMTSPYRGPSALQSARIIGARLGSPISRCQTGRARADRPGRPGWQCCPHSSLRSWWRLDCSIKVYKLATRCRKGTFYPDEIEIQEAHSKHRKLDSQTTLSHRARNRAADGLRPQAWPLRASGCDHDPGGLPPWPAGLRGLRPAMAADRALRGPPARSPRQAAFPAYTQS